MFAFSSLFFLLICLFNQPQFGLTNDKPKLIPGPTIHQKVGENTAITCILQRGSQPVQYEWFKDGVQIQKGLSHTITGSGISSSLALESLKIEDTGNYSCKATNIYGSDSSTTTLIIEGPPQWLERPANIEVNPSGEASARCRGFGYPTPKVIWKKQDGGKLYPLKSTTNTQFVFRSSDRMEESFRYSHLLSESLRHRDQGPKDTKV